MLYGYARISTPKQSIERQVRNILRSYPDAHILQEAYTGTKMTRPQWDKLYKAARAGDTIIFDSVSRMSRSAEDGVAVYMELYKRGVELVFIKEPHINTAVYHKALEDSHLTRTGTAVDAILDGVTQYLQALAAEQVKIAFEQAEKEVEDLHQRTREGIVTAKLNGKQIGQREGAKLTTKKSVEAKEVIRKHSKDFGGTLTDTEMLQLTGLARNTYYKYKRELKAE